MNCPACHDKGGEDCSLCYCDHGKPYTERCESCATEDKEFFDEEGNPKPLTK